MYLTSHFVVACPWAVEKNDVSSFSQSPLIGSFVRFAGYEDKHKSSNKFEFGQDWIIHFGVIHPWTQKFFPIDLKWRKWCLHFFSVTMNSIFIKLTGNKDRHEMLDRFEFRSDLTSHFGVTCPSVLKKMMSLAFFQSPLTRYLSNLQITRTDIWACSDYSLWSYSPLSPEFFPHRLLMEKKMYPSFLSYSEFNLRQTYR